jgi:hypothetical protein
LEPKQNDTDTDTDTDTDIDTDTDTDIDTDTATSILHVSWQRRTSGEKHNGAHLHPTLVVRLCVCSGDNDDDHQPSIVGYGTTQQMKQQIERNQRKMRGAVLKRIQPAAAHRGSGIDPRGGGRKERWLVKR